MNVALYARVSTTDQNCEMQLRDLREWAARRGWPVFAEYVDTGWSGKLDSRPQLNRLKADARLRKFDVVLVWKLDRWGRSISHSISSIHELIGLGVRFIAITQNIDTDESNPMARFILHIMAAFAELERELIRERVIAGLRAAKHQGKRLGRPKKVFDRSRILELRQLGRSVRAIAKEMEISIATAHELISAFEKPLDSEPPKLLN